MGVIIQIQLYMGGSDSIRQDFFVCCRKKSGINAATRTLNPKLSVTMLKYVCLHVRLTVAFNTVGDSPRPKII